MGNKIFTSWKSVAVCFLTVKKISVGGGGHVMGALTAITHYSFCLFILLWLFIKILFVEFTEKDSISFRFARGFVKWMRPSHNPMIPAIVSRMHPIVPLYVPFLSHCPRACLINKIPNPVKYYFFSRLILYFLFTKFVFMNYECDFSDLNRLPHLVALL